MIERAADGDHFTDEDDRVLTELARQVGLALHNVQLDSALQESLENLKRANEDLRTSRARIVATGDAERRKIERNLHDGAQQHLVALAVNLRLTKDILADDPEAAAEMLDALGDAVKDTIQELRDLAHGIYPPLLMDAGLTDALRAAANRSPLAVSVAAEGIGRYSTELEAAVYFCCLEALQNAAKHAPDSSVSISLIESDGVLQFSVKDDGPGFDVAAATAGHGHVNMNDRLGAIGGTVEWRSAPGEGAEISGTIPCRDRRRTAARRRSGGRRRRARPSPSPAPRSARAGSASCSSVCSPAWWAPSPSAASRSARRTTTAYDRLGEATKVDDARGTVLRYPELVDEIADLPMVTDLWVGGIGVAKVEGDNSFIGITAGPRESFRRSSIRSCLEGRLPGRSPDPDVIEIVLREDFQREIDVPMGAEFPVRFLSEADYFRFDTRFEGGEVHGPEAVRRVVGTVRMAGGDTTVPPTFASAAALESHPDAFIGTSYFVRLEGGAAGFEEFEAAVEELVGDRTLPPEAEEFSVVDVSTPSVAAAAVDNTALLLGRALMMFALVHRRGRRRGGPPGAGPPPHRHRPRPRGRAGAGA